MHQHIRDNMNKKGSPQTHSCGYFLMGAMIVNAASAFSLAHSRDISKMPDMLI